MSRLKAVPDFRGNLPAVCKRQLCRNDCSDHRNLFRSRYQPAFYRRRHHHVLLLQRTGNYHRRNEQDVLYPVPVICRKCVCKCIDVCAGRIKPWGIILKFNRIKNRRRKLSSNGGFLYSISISRFLLFNMCDQFLTIFTGIDHDGVASPQLVSQDDLRSQCLHILLGARWLSAPMPGSIWPR